MYYKRFVTIAMLSILSAVSLFAQSVSLEPDRTLCYAEKDGQSLCMDIYGPAVQADKPTLIHIFGGGFAEGDRTQEWLRPWFRQMNSLGYRMISIDYRLGLKGVKGVSAQEFSVLLDRAIDMAVEDLVSATAYLLEHGSELGIDPQNLVLTGSSAGAITAQQAEYEICAGSALASVLPEGFNYRGVMAFAGAVLVEGQLAYGKTPCPIMMFHGDEDELVPYDLISYGPYSFSGPCQILPAAQKAGGVTRIYRFPGNNHAVAGYMPQTVDKQVDFLERTVIRGSKECIDAKIVDPSLPTYRVENPNSLYEIQPDEDAAHVSAGADAECDLTKSSRWRILPDHQGIIWDARTGLPHEDHLEMSGEKVSCVLRWGVDESGAFHGEKSLVFPLLRTIPNNTHASMNFRIDTDIPSLLAVNGRSLIKEQTESVRINGLVEVQSLFSKANDFIGVGVGKTETACVRLTRTIFPSTTLPAVYERCVIRNVTGDNLLITIPEFVQVASTDRYAGVDGAYLVRAELDGAWTGWMAPGEERTFTLIYQAYREGGEVTSPLLQGSEPVTRTVAAEQPLHPDTEAEFRARQALVTSLGESLVLETPDSVLNEMFRFSKIRGCESIYRTKCGLMHGPGGESYYAAVWANDQAEYINPFFPFVGYAGGDESAFNSFMLFSRYINDDYTPIPSSIIAEGEDIWNGCGDRGDAAMIAYGAGRYALARADRNEAEQLWPLIEWCLEYCRRNLNPEGVVRSDTDELENRFESGDANLCTSTLYYDALLSAAYLGGEIGISKSQTERYRAQARALEKNIEKYFGATVSGYETYQYYKGNTLLRSWICMPLIAGIRTRAEGTAAALSGPELMTENGCLTEQGSDVFWDRATLYAFRGIFYTGNTSKALSLLQDYSCRRLLGEHVPYAVEAWPEGSQRHLSAESGLYCRVFTEGLFGIRPTGFRSFTMNATLPQGWDEMSLRHCRAFGSDFDITVYRTSGGAVRVKVYDHATSRSRVYRTTRGGEVKVTM